MACAYFLWFCQFCFPDVCIQRVDNQQPKQRKDNFSRRSLLLFQEDHPENSLGDGMDTDESKPQYNVGKSIIAMRQIKLRAHFFCLYIYYLICAIYLLSYVLLFCHFTKILPVYALIIIDYSNFLFVRKSHVRLALFLTYSWQNNKRVQQNCQ